MQVSRVEFLFNTLHNGKMLFRTKKFRRSGYDECKSKTYQRNMDKRLQGSYSFECERSRVLAFRREWQVPTTINR